MPISLYSMIGVCSFVGFQIGGRVAARPATIQTHRTVAVLFPYGTHGTDVRLTIGKKGLHVVVEFAGIFVGTFSALCNFTTLHIIIQTVGFTKILYSARFFTPTSARFLFVL